MARIINFNVTCSDCLKLADEALKNGDLPAHFRHLKAALKLDESCVEASLALARAYVSIDAYDLSDRTLFKALSLDPTEDERAEIVSLLVSNFFDLGQPDVAEYYLCELSDDFDFDFPDDPDDLASEFKPVPKGEELYEALIAQAYDLLASNKPKEALKLMDEIPLTSPSREAADYIVLICLMLNDDSDATIYNANKTLEKYPHSVSVMSVLATAYLKEEDVESASRIVERIKAEDCESVEDILHVLPLLVSLGEHADVFEYCRRLLKKTNLNLHAMLWLAQSLYNLGQKDEARRTFVKIRAILGETSNADYFLKEMEKGEETMEYSLTLPAKEKIRRMKLMEEALDKSESERSAFLQYDQLRGGELQSVLTWACMECPEKIRYYVVDSLAGVNVDWVVPMFKDLLLQGDAGYPVTTRIVVALLDLKKREQTFKVVAQDRFKDICFQLPEAYLMLPANLQSAYELTMGDIIYRDEEPNPFLECLTEAVDDAFLVDGQQLLGVHAEIAKLAKLKSMPTLIAALMSKAYADDYDDSKAEMVERFGVNRRTFDKYFNMLFGGDYD